MIKRNIELPAFRSHRPPKQEYPLPCPCCGYRNLFIVESGRKGQRFFCQGHRYAKNGCTVLFIIDVPPWYEIPISYTQARRIPDE